MIVAILRNGTILTPVICSGGRWRILSRPLKKGKPREDGEFRKTSREVGDDILQKINLAKRNNKSVYYRAKIFDVPSSFDYS